jgi:glyoxylase-like metal-dependent hydrolase (beta-lactamase superfamily II)
MSTIPFVREIDFEYGRVDQVSPMIRRVIAENPTPFTFHGTGTYIVGRGEVAVIDPGPAIDTHLAALMKAVEGKRVTHILITHTHMDHSPAAEAFKRATGAPTYGFGPHVPGRCWVGVDGLLSKGGDYDFRPDQAVADGDVIEGAGWTLEAVHTPGHIHNHLCFAFKEENALFSGDHVMGWSTTVVSPPDGDMSDYMASLDKLLARNEATYWPTHGPAITDPERHVHALKAHREGREHAILEVLATGVEDIAHIVRLNYAKVPEHLHPAAARTTLSHLVRMIEMGRVRCDGPPNLDARFRPA